MTKRDMKLRIVVVGGKEVEVISSLYCPPDNIYLLDDRFLRMLCDDGFGIEAICKHAISKKIVLHPSKVPSLG